ncbi:MAG: flagellar biosynthetic protein FliQ [Planctomycetota bacterium]
MNLDFLTASAQEALLMCVSLAAPLLVVGLLMALVTGLLQAITQVHDPTISLVPRVMAVMIALFVSLPWLIGRLVEFSQHQLTSVPFLNSGG